MRFLAPLFRVFTSPKIEIIKRGIKEK